ncbi:hypothetical protein [Streptomyces hydrogenans]
MRWPSVVERAREIVESYEGGVTLRQVFYVLVSDGALEKTERDYKRMCEYVGMARRSGRIPWDAIRDDKQPVAEAPPSLRCPPRPPAMS